MQPGPQRTATDDLLRHNEAYAAAFETGDRPAPPARKVAVLTCMDARLDPAQALGLQLGDAHVIRNAGGVATTDAIRSLLISQRLLGTEEILVVHHTECGMLSFTDAELRDRIEAETGVRPPFPMESFTDTDESVRETVARIQASPFIPHQAVRGFVYDVATGRLREVG
ncbi:MAG TPA: carbonic anhydrase [Acidimicrobiales bacterium]|nr:carbonic anhydrase [Acidimicrobiales bacterium]